MGASALQIIPLGGATEIGRNMTAYRLGDQILVCDCGLMFPDQEMPGVDILIPDITFLLENREQVVGICLTHGHEDHIGALPYVLRQLPVPIYATELTLGLIENKLEEHDLWRQTEAHLVRDGDRVTLGDFEVEFVHVCHSVPGSCALVIRTPAGTVVHTGDFKFDQTPEDGKLTDLAALARAGEEGVLALVVDSTNVDKPGYVASEAVVREALDRLFMHAPGRIILTTFASNINRLQQVIDISRQYGRKVAFAGRSMQENSRIARELGYLRVGEETLVRLENIEEYPPSEITILTTGAQGEPLSALTRMAMGDHRFVKIQPGDTVVFSATPIPGNEDLILRTINHLFKQGANVLDIRTDPQIHVSGHANREELKLMLNLTRPLYVIPVHGEYRHKELWRRMGEAMNYVVIKLENGDVLEVTLEEAVIRERVTAGAVFVDGTGISGVEDAVLRDRWHLAQDGIVVVVCTVDRTTGRLIAGPDVVARGAILTSELDQVTEEARQRTIQILESLPEDGTVDWASVRTDIRRAINKLLQQTTGRRPMVVPIVMDI